MTTEKYYTIATKRGKEKIQDYYRQNKTLPLTHMGFGGVDGDDANHLRPNVEMAVVPNEWARIGIERKPDEGFIGGGATIENKVDEYKGKWICNVGIYDEDGELILISAYRPLLVDPEESIVSSYPINIQSVLANAEHVVVQTDTSITHPTHDEMNQALENLDNKLSKYATTEAAGLIELATHQEVSTGQDTKRAVTPATLKPELDEIKELINESEGSLSQPATTERLGLTELATQQEVDQRTGGEKVVTAQTLDKPGLISFLQRYADEEVKKLKELIFGGNPSAALDTLFELANAYEGAADSIQNILNTLSTKLPTSTFETFQATYNQWKSQIQAQVNRKWEAVDASTSRKGIVQLTNAVNSTSQVLAASALGLKTAYDKAVSAYNLANGKWTAVNASTSVKGIVKLVDSVTSTSTSDGATPNSVRQVKIALDNLSNELNTESKDLQFIRSYLENLPRYYTFGSSLTATVTFTEGEKRNVVELTLTGLSGDLISGNSMRSGFFEVTFTPKYTSNLPQEYSVYGEVIEVIPKTPSATHNLKVRVHTWASGLNVSAGTQFSFNVSIKRRVERTDLDHMWS